MGNTDIALRLIKAYADVNLADKVSYLSALTCMATLRKICSSIDWPDAAALRDEHGLFAVGFSTAKAWRRGRPSEQRTFFSRNYWRHFIAFDYAGGLHGATHGSVARLRGLCQPAAGCGRQY